MKNIIGSSKMPKYKPYKERNGDIIMVSPTEHFNKRVSNNFPKCTTIRHLVIAYLASGVEMTSSQLFKFLEEEARNNLHAKKCIPGETLKPNTIYNTLNALKNSELATRELLLISTKDKGVKHYKFSQAAKELSMEELIKLCIEKRPPTKKKIAEVSTSETVSKDKIDDTEEVKKKTDIRISGLTDKVIALGNGMNDLANNVIALVDKVDNKFKDVYSKLDSLLQPFETIDIDNNSRKISELEHTMDEIAKEHIILTDKSLCHKDTPKIVLRVKGDINFYSIPKDN
jgi:hypothetical protein